TVLDGKGSAQGRTEALSQAIALNPAGIVLGGFDAKEQASTIKKATDAKIPLVSWHGGPKAGP
ncbi:MAG TPA: sugar ABC transporter substrate-binding protein, partial [Propionibacteriaceae bacterium]|nr:sugar ABC transporter substrate-binding protein [Propionibacteriaceae bacterium]